MVSPGTLTTPRAITAVVPPTPSFAIGAATPGFSPLTATYTQLTATAEEVSAPSEVGTPQATAPGDAAGDYFASNVNNQSEASSESNKIPGSPGTGENPALVTPTSPTEKKKGFFGAKAFAGMSLSKKITRTSTEVKAPVTAAEEK